MSFRSPPPPRDVEIVSVSCSGTCWVGVCLVPGRRPVFKSRSTWAPSSLRTLCYRTVIASHPQRKPVNTLYLGFPGRSAVKNVGLIPGLGRSPGGGHGNPLPCFCLENPVDRGARWATVHGPKSRTRLKPLRTAYHVPTSRYFFLRIYCHTHEFNLLKCDQTINSTMQLVFFHLIIDCSHLLMSEHRDLLHDF